MENIEMKAGDIAKTKIKGAWEFNLVPYLDVFGKQRSYYPWVIIDENDLLIFVGIRNREHWKDYVFFCKNKLVYLASGDFIKL